MVEVIFEVDFVSSFDFFSCPPTTTSTISPESRSFPEF